MTQALHGRGRITAQGSGCELLDDPKVRAAYLGSH
jgi:ABC-type branched-subunit amino acid transport system ATPase component